MVFYSFDFEINYRLYILFVALLFDIIVLVYYVRVNILNLCLFVLSAGKQGGNISPQGDREGTSLRREAAREQRTLIFLPGRKL